MFYISEAPIYRVCAAIGKVLSIEVYLLPKRNTTADLIRVLFSVLPSGFRLTGSGRFLCISLLLVIF